MKAITLRGTGDDVVSIRVPGRGPGIVYARTYSQGVFDVFARGSGSDDSGDGALLVNEMAPYTGVTPVDFGDSRTTSLVIKASGPWLIRINAASAAPAFSAARSGHGDAVLRYTGRASTATVDNEHAHGNFIVVTWTPSDIGASGDLLVNDVGDFRGVEPWTAGPMWVVINSDGAWTIATK